jgi:LysR family hydrogen peroxide-inducible transcriptional activator
VTLRDLEYLVAVYELRHFTHAAERCHVSQPTLSGQLQKLEDELGVVIVERSTRKVIFTETGVRLAEQARRVLLESRRIHEMAVAARDPFRGELHVGLIPTVGPWLLPLVMRGLNSAFPELEFFLYELKTDEILEKLGTGDLDCGVLARVPGTQKFADIPLYTEDLVLAAPKGHHLLGQGHLDRKSLSGEKVLMLEDGHCLRDQAMGVCFAAGAEEDSHYQATSLDTLRYMVEAGSGVTLMPMLATIRQKSDRVVYRQFSEPRPSRDIILLFRVSSPRRKCMEAVAESIREAVEYRPE